MNFDHCHLFGPSCGRWWQCREYHCWWAGGSGLTASTHHKIKHENTKSSRSNRFCLSKMIFNLFASLSATWTFSLIDFELYFFTTALEMTTKTTMIVFVSWNDISFKRTMSREITTIFVENLFFSKGIFNFFSVQFFSRTFAIFRNLLQLKFCKISANYFINFVKLF